MTVINSKSDRPANTLSAETESRAIENDTAVLGASASELSDNAESAPRGENIGTSESIERIMPISDRAATLRKRSLFSEIKLAPREKGGEDIGDGTDKSDGTSESEDTVQNEDSGKKVNLASMKNMIGKMNFGKKNAIVVASLALICGALAINYALTGGDSRNYYDFAGSGEDTGSSIVGAETSEGEPVNGEPSTPDASDEGSSDVGVSEQSGDAYFSAAAVERRRARDESLEVLQLVLDSEDALQESKDSALQSMTKIAAQIEQESNIESLIKAKGFEECIAVVGDDGATVIVSSDGLLANEVAQITEIMCEQTSLPASAINIVEKAAG